MYNRTVMHVTLLPCAYGLPRRERLAAVAHTISKVGRSASHDLPDSVDITDKRKRSIGYVEFFGA